MPFRIALSGLNAASSDLKVTGNNIANVGTTGFKSSRAEFADIFALSYGGVSNTAIGGGVRLSSVSQLFAQGTIEPTESSLDLAINGQGFFVLNDRGTRVFSRAGAFQVDNNGFVRNAQNHRLQVYPSVDPAGSAFNTASPTDLQLSNAPAAPNATTTVSAELNLQADATDLGAGAIDPADPSTYSYSTTITLYDSLGANHASTMYFRKTGANTWDLRQYVDGALVDTTTGPQTTVTFNNDGSLNGPSTIAYQPYNPGNGAADINLSLDIANTTQYGTGFSVNSLSQDGYTTGRLNNIQIDETGIVSARYTNGQFNVLGKVALGIFPNPNGLQQLGDNAWAETIEAGTLRLGEAGSGSLGFIQSSSLEASNVDISKELVNLITAQRNFQANAQVITTADTITQTIINIR
jgi:flagellar hook protein FlgE